MPHHMCRSEDNLGCQHLYLVWALLHIPASPNSKHPESPVAISYLAIKGAGITDVLWH